MAGLGDVMAKRVDVVHICNMSPHHGEGVDRNGKLWRWDFGYMVGPTFVNKSGEPLKNQPMTESHPAWEPFERWLAEYHPKGDC